MRIDPATRVFLRFMGTVAILVLAILVTGATCGDCLAVYVLVPVAAITWVTGMIVSSHAYYRHQGS